MADLHTTLDFSSASGRPRRARLELPPRPARASAVLLHALPDASPAALRLPRLLAAQGLTVMQLAAGRPSVDAPGDAGLVATHDDLGSALDALASAHGAPALVVGHGAGAAAALTAFPSVPTARALVLLNCPATSAGVRRSLSTLDAGSVPAGAATARRADFLTDDRLADAAARVRVPVLLAHAEDDEVAPIADGLRLFERLTCPKSFFTLRGGHALDDAPALRRAAAMVGAWMSPHVETNGATEASGVVVTEPGDGKLANDVHIGAHHLVADEPVAAGGGDLGPSPYDFLLAGLGACTSMTLRLYADRKGWPLTGVRVSLEHTRVHADDCASCETKEGRMERVTRVIALEGPLDAEQQRRLLQIAEKCPVHRTLHAGIWIVSRLEP
jgi:putative redox protein